MVPPKRKGTGTPEKAESSTKRQALTTPSPPPLTHSSSASPSDNEAITPRHNGTKQKSGHYSINDTGIEYLWYECKVLVDTLGTNQPPLMRVIVLDDEDTLPVYGNPMEMDIRMLVERRTDNWLHETVTLHFRRDTRDDVRRNLPYELVFVFLGEEGYPKGKEEFETNLIRDPAQDIPRRPSARPNFGFLV